MRFSPPVGADIEAIGVAICTACRELHCRDLLAATDGNISVRLADGRIIITPAGVNKARLEPRQLSIMSSAGKVLIGNPSAERALHSASTPPRRRHAPLSTPTHRPLSRGAWQARR